MRKAADDIASSHFPGEADGGTFTVVAGWLLSADNREAKLGRSALHVGAAARPLVLPDVPLLLRRLPVVLGVSSTLLVISYSLRHVGLARSK